MDGYTNKSEGFLNHVYDTSHPGHLPRGIHIVLLPTSIIFL
jgi:hypothetical protein